MDMALSLVLIIALASVYALACCLFCLCDRSQRGQVLYRLHK